jgi:hypothetical protein
MPAKKERSHQHLLNLQRRFSINSLLVAMGAMREIAATARTPARPIFGFQDYRRHVCGGVQIMGGTELGGSVHRKCES